MQKTWIKTPILIAAVIAAGLLYLLAPILTPFLISALLAYLADPLVMRLTKWHLPRLLSVIIVFLILFLIIGLIVLLLIPLIQKQIMNLTVLVPKVMTWMQTIIVPWVGEHIGIDNLIDTDTLTKTLAASVGKASGVAAWLWKSGFAIVEWFTNLILIPVVTFYLLRDWRKLLIGCQHLLPRKIEPGMVRLVKECDEVLSAFFRGQLLVMLSLGLIYSVGLSIIGLQIGLVIGLVAGLVSIVPYLGFIIGILSASVAAFIQFDSAMDIWPVFVVFGIGQILESVVLTPNLVGDRIGLHPVAVIFAILAGGSLFGFFGVLLALPVASVIMVLIRFVNRHYQESQLYQ